MRKFQGECWTLRHEATQKNYLIIAFGRRVAYVWWRDGGAGQMQVSNDARLRDHHAARTTALHKVQTKIQQGYTTKAMSNDVPITITDAMVKSPDRVREFRDAVAAAVQTHVENHLNHKMEDQQTVARALNSQINDLQQRLVNQTYRAESAEKILDSLLGEVDLLIAKAPDRLYKPKSYRHGVWDTLSEPLKNAAEVAHAHRVGRRLAQQSTQGHTPGRTRKKVILVDTSGSMYGRVERARERTKSLLGLHPGAEVIGYGYLARPTDLRELDPDGEWFYPNGGTPTPEQLAEWVTTLGDVQIVGIITDDPDGGWGSGRMSKAFPNVPIIVTPGVEVP